MLPVFFILLLLVSAEWHFFVLLISIALMTNDAEHIFMSLMAVSPFA